MSVSRGPAAALVGVLALVLTGCGGSPRREAAPAPTTPAFTELSPTEIARRALDATADAPTLHAHVVVQIPHRVLIADSVRDEDGRCSTSATQTGFRFWVVRTEDHNYVRGNPAYWRRFSDGKVRKEMTAAPSRWARFPVDDETPDLCDPEKFLALLDVDDALDGLTVEPPRLYDGVSAIDLLSDDNDIRIIVRADAPHYLLELNIGGSDMLITDFGDPVSVDVPAEDELIAFRSTAATT
jgi:hypothetical protein